MTVSPESTDDQCNDVNVLLDEFPDVMSYLPRLTTFGVHQIKLISNKLIRSKPYPLPFTSRDTVCDEVRKMLEAGVIEPSDSRYLLSDRHRKEEGFVTISEQSTKYLCLTRKLFLVLTISL